MFGFEKLGQIVVQGVDVTTSVISDKRVKGSGRSSVQFPLGTGTLNNFLYLCLPSSLLLNSPNYFHIIQRLPRSEPTIRTHPLPSVVTWLPDIASLHFLSILSASDLRNIRTIPRTHAQRRKEVKELSTVSVGYPTLVVSVSVETFTAKRYIYVLDVKKCAWLSK